MSALFGIGGARRRYGRREDHAPSASILGQTPCSRIAFSFWKQSLALVGAPFHSRQSCPQFGNLSFGDSDPGGRDRHSPSLTAPQSVGGGTLTHPALRLRPPTCVDSRSPNGSPISKLVRPYCRKELSPRCRQLSSNSNLSPRSAAVVSSSTVSECSGRNSTLKSKGGRSAWS